MSFFLDFFLRNSGVIISFSHFTDSHRNTMLNYNGLRSIVYGGRVMNSLLWDVFACKFSFAEVGFRKAEIDNTSNCQICAKTRQVSL